MLNWVMKSVTAKGSIILFLANAVATQIRAFIDDDEKTANELCNELERVFTSSNPQVIQNPKNKLDGRIHRDGAKFENTSHPFSQS